MAETVKHLPAMRETQVWFLDWEDPLEKEMAIHSSSLVCKIPWTEEADRLQSMGSQRVGHDWATDLTWSETHSHNLHFKITGLARRFSGRRNMSSSRIHYCYTIVTKECRKKMFVLSSFLRIPDPYLLLESPRPPFPPQGPWTYYQPA